MLTINLERFVTRGSRLWSYHPIGRGDDWTETLQCSSNGRGSYPESSHNEQYFATLGASDGAGQERETSSWVADRYLSKASAVDELSAGSETENRAQLDATNLRHHAMLIKEERTKALETADNVWRLKLFYKVQQQVELKQPKPTQRHQHIGAVPSFFRVFVLLFRFGEVTFSFP